MNEVLQLGPRQRSELFSETARQTGIDSIVVEKDFWVCWTLQELFRLPQIGEHLVFKGGTSLSKVFKVIQRFSEDIDVSIDRAFLGFGGPNEPEVLGSPQRLRTGSQPAPTLRSSQLRVGKLVSAQGSKGSFNPMTP